MHIVHTFIALWFVKMLAVLFCPFVFGHKFGRTMSSGCGALCSFTFVGV